MKRLLYMLFAAVLIMAFTPALAAPADKDPADGELMSGWYRMEDDALETLMAGRDARAARVDDAVCTVEGCAVGSYLTGLAGENADAAALVNALSGRCGVSFGEIDYCELQASEVYAWGGEGPAAVEEFYRVGLIGSDAWYTVLFRCAADEGSAGIVQCRILERMPFEDEISTESTLVHTGEAVVYNCGEWAEMRQSPDGSAASLIRVPLGAMVESYECETEGWRYCEYDGQGGYLPASVLEDLY